MILYIYKYEVFEVEFSVSLYILKLCVVSVFLGVWFYSLLFFFLVFDLIVLWLLLELMEEIFF